MTYVLIILCHLLLTAYKTSAHEEKALPLQEQWITVFIHGTMGLRCNMSLDNFIKIVKGDIKHSTYKRSVRSMRNDPFFYAYQPIQMCGLHKINYDDNTPTAAGLFAYIFDELLPDERREREANAYYTFGWSGLLSAAKRHQEAHDLYKELKALIAASPHPQPKIRVVGYSHGGNLALNLAAIHDEKYPHDTLQVDELICLGVPVQNETEHLIYSPFFKRIFHFYSREDHVQRLDCFSVRRFFSKRRFKEHKYKQLPESLTQIEIKVLSKYDLAGKPLKRYVDRSPGHTELWFFGWTIDSFRPYFPLYPLPTSTILPAIIQEVETFKPYDRHLIVEVKIDQELISMRARHHHRRKTVPFISLKKLKALQTYALCHQPDTISAEVHKAHLNNAVKQARGNNFLTTSHKKCARCLN